MSNMSYCRFQNTAADLADCSHALQEMIERRGTKSKLGREELRAARNLVLLCYDIVVMVTEHADEPIEDLTEESLEDAVIDINEACTGEEE